jgi:streptogramin lyase
MLKRRILISGMIVLGAGILSTGILRPSPAASAGLPLASTMLTGNTRAADGGAMEGVAVSARLVNGTVTTSVYTDEQGNYYFPALPGGRYRVWAQAAGYEAGRSELNLSPTRETRQDFTLKTTKDFSKQLSTFEYMAALPGDTPQDRRMKQVFGRLCTTCHVGSYALQNRFDEKGWLAIMNRYEEINDDEDEPAYHPNTHHTHEILKHYKGELATYLAKMRGPGPSPMKFKPYPRPTGDAARVVITEYSVPPAETPDELVDQDGSDWSEGIPPGVGSRGVHDVGIDSNGNVWISDREMNRYRTYAKVDVETGKVTNFRLSGPNGMARMTHGLKSDPNGIIWIELRDSPPTGDRHVLLRVDPKSGESGIFDPSSAGSGRLGNTIEVDGKGKIWTAARPGAYAYDPATQKFTYFQAPTRGVGGYGIAGDADGNGWFCHPDRDIIGFADYKTGKVSEIALRPPPGIEELLTAEDRQFNEQAKADSISGLLTSQGPRRMGAYGNYVWWPNWFGGSISRVDIRTHEVSYYPLPFPDSHAYDVALDKNGNVWTALLGDDRVAKFDPNTQQWTVYKLPSLGYEVRYIAVDNRKEIPEVWVPSNRASKLARLQFRTDQQLETVKAKRMATPGK